MINENSIKKRTSGEPIRWKGKHVFFIGGTDHDDDTIMIPSSHRKDEILYKLVLPTLCLTYADMKFANDIGGVQMDYPDSKVYGSKYFDPPVIISGEKEIEKFTWVRGAEKITIGPKETIVEWWGWHHLVIPKLRIKSKEKVRALLRLSEVRITVREPFAAIVQQYADGRHVGGVQVVKRHPLWEPDPESNKYDLFIRVIDGKTRRAIPEARVKIFEWDKEKGGFVTEATYYSNKIGIVDVMDLQCSDKKLVTIFQNSYLTQTFRFRPLSGQQVKKFFRLWRSEKQEISYTWRLQNTLRGMAEMTGVSKVDLLRMNRLRSEKELRPGTEIKAKTHKGIFVVQQGDNLGSISKYFCFDNEDELIHANELSLPVKLYPDQHLVLPGWLFIKANHNQLFEKIDEQFCIPGGWSRPALRTLHDDPTRAYEDEIVAVPTKEFIKDHKMKRLY